jgi:N-acetylglutamate synthase-like GNAT family acetyltransferase
MIRIATPTDYVEMDSVFRASAEAFCSQRYDAATIKAWAGQAWPDRFKLGKENGDEQYVYTKDGRIICFGCINLSSEKIVSLFVHPAFSGQHVGEMMLEYVIGRAKKSGINVLKLDSSTNAVSFYKRHGFSEIGHGKYKTQSGLQMDSVQMELKFF